MSQTVVMIPWGWFSDRYGRKPTVLFSMVGSAFFSLLFGTARSLTALIVYRAAAGLCAGSILSVLLRGMLAQSG